MTDYRNCPSCGRDWEEGAKFCPDDGAPLTEVKLDRYRLLRRVAQGGMSEVFEAEHEHIARRVALKLLRSSLCPDGEALERLRREARAASSIGHPNIIDVTDFGQTEDGSVYMVMEWLDGHTLRELLDQGPIDPSVALDIAYQAAAGLAAAHSIGVIHRDVKPDNLGITRSTDGSYQVKVLDFGIAKMAIPVQQKLTRTGTFIGTPAYVSPEQARGERIDGRTDVYSLGCVLYEMFSGHKLYGPASAMELVQLHATVMPPPPSHRAPERAIPPEVEALIMSCLAKPREERPATMGRLRDALDHLRSGMVTLRGVPPQPPHPLDDDLKATLLFRKGMAIEFRDVPTTPAALPAAHVTFTPTPTPTPVAAPPPPTPQEPLPLFDAASPVAPGPAEPRTATPVSTPAPVHKPRRMRTALIAIAAFAIVGTTLGIVATRGSGTATAPTKKSTTTTTANKTEPAKKSEPAKKTEPTKKSEPANKADEPVAKADEPVAKVDEPVAKVDEPVAKADEPVAKADEPATAPPATKPVETAEQKPVDKPVVDAEQPAADGSWSAETKTRKFRIKLTASPRPLMPRAPIELDFEIHDAKSPISWSLTERRLRADIHFVHYVHHDTLGMVSGNVDDTGKFGVIFSVPQTGKYHLRVDLTDGGRVLGRATLDICVGADPDSTDGKSLCPALNALPAKHGAALSRDLFR